MLATFICLLLTGKSFAIQLLLFQHMARQTGRWTDKSKGLGFDSFY